METNIHLRCFWLILFVITGFTMISCSDDSDSESEEVDDLTLIYGSWKHTFNVGGYQLIHFHQDGTYVAEEIDKDDNTVLWIENGYFQVKDKELIMDIDDDDEMEDKFKYKIHKLTSSLLGIQLTDIYSYGKWESVVGDGGKDEQISLFKKVK